MARPFQENLKYFSFDVNFFEDKKIKALKGKFGLSGVIAYIYILCQVYKESYYVEVDEDFISCMSDDLNISENTTRQILKYLFSRSLLCEIKDSTLAKPVTIVTSKSIQRRYQEAKKDYKRDIFVKAEYWILEKFETYGFIKVRPDDNKSPKNTNKSPNNYDKSPKNGTKESKVNKNKINQNETDKSKSADGGLHNLDRKNEFDNSEYRQQLIDAYGEDLIIQYEKKFDEWIKGKKAVNVNKWFEIDKWLCEDFG